MRVLIRGYVPLRRGAHVRRSFFLLREKDPLIGIYPPMGASLSSSQTPPSMLSTHDSLYTPHRGGIRPMVKKPGSSRAPRPNYGNFRRKYIEKTGKYENTTGEYEKKTAKNEISTEKNTEKREKNTEKYEKHTGKQDKIADKLEENTEKSETKCGQTVDKWGTRTYIHRYKTNHTNNNEGNHYSFDFQRGFSKPIQVLKNAQRNNPHIFPKVEISRSLTVLSKFEQLRFLPYILPIRNNLFDQRGAKKYARIFQIKIRNSLPLNTIPPLVRSIFSDKMNTPEMDGDFGQEINVRIKGKILNDSPFQTILAPYGPLQNNLLNFRPLSLPPETPPPTSPPIYPQEEVHVNSLENLKRFWDYQGLGVDWRRKYWRVCSDDVFRPDWFCGGKLNITYNLLDTHVKQGLGDRTAVICESAYHPRRELTFGKLLDKVSRFAGGLKDEFQVRKGDVVLIYMPNSLECLISMLACARIGAVHSNIFGGLGVASIYHRLKHTQAKLVICANVGYEADKQIDYLTRLKSALQLLRTERLAALYAAEHTHNPKITPLCHKFPPQNNYIHPAPNYNLHPAQQNTHKNAQTNSHKNAQPNKKAIQNSLNFTQNQAENIAQNYAEKIAGQNFCAEILAQNYCAENGPKIEKEASAGRPALSSERDFEKSAKNRIWRKDWGNVGGPPRLSALLSPQEGIHTSRSADTPIRCIVFDHKISPQNMAPNTTENIPRNIPQNIPQNIPLGVCDSDLRKYADWDEVLRKGDPTEAVAVDSSDPLYIIYTSGTTSEPKGIVRGHGGQTVSGKYAFQKIYNIPRGSVFFCAADLAWVLGHNCAAYGPLLNAATALIYEGKPVLTNGGRTDPAVYWQLCEKYKVRGVFTSATAVRYIRNFDPDGHILAQYDLPHLDALYIAGERTDAQTFDWLAHHLGKKGAVSEGGGKRGENSRENGGGRGCVPSRRRKIRVIDNWWQTETGSPMSGIMRGFVSDSPRAALNGQNTSEYHPDIPQRRAGRQCADKRYETCEIYAKKCEKHRKKNEKKEENTEQKNGQNIECDKIDRTTALNEEWDALTSIPPRVNTSGKAIPGWDLRILSTREEAEKYCEKVGRSLRVDTMVSENSVEIPSSEKGEIVDVSDLEIPGHITVKLPLPPGCMIDLFNASAPNLCFKTYFQKFPGHYDTGDYGIFSPDKYLTILERADDAINVAGHRLCTAAMSEIVLTHPKVLECAVVGVPHHVKGTIPVGFIVLNTLHPGTVQQSSFAPDQTNSQITQTKIEQNRQNDCQNSEKNRENSKKNRENSAKNRENSEKNREKNREKQIPEDKCEQNGGKKLESTNNVLQQLNEENKELIGEIVQLVRTNLGPIACFKKCYILSQMPRTKSGKILKKLLAQIIQNNPNLYIPSTIEDASIIPQIQTLAPLLPLKFSKV